MIKYIGSKRRLVSVLGELFARSGAQTALDLFTGTTRVAQEFKRRGAEAKIRQYLIDNNFIDAVIQLPPDLFFGTTIATCIVVLKKSKRDNATLFIDASNEFTRSGNKNKLLPEHQQKILDAYTQRQDFPHFARLVHNSDIAKNGYNIAVPSYIEQKDEREAVDIRALNAEIARIVARQAALRQEIDAIVAELGGGA